MKGYIIKRLLQLIPIIIGITLLSFAMMRLAGSDAVNEMYAKQGAIVSEEVIQKARAELGLDKPFIVQYFIWLGGLFRGDMGVSYISGKNVFSTFVSKLPATLLLTLMSIILTVAVSLPLGILAATHQNSWMDSLTMALSMFFASMPNFWFALILVLVFSIRLGWLPAVGYESWKNYVMPTIAMGLHGAAIFARQTRSSMLEVLRADHVTTARAKGQKEGRTIYGHVLRNALIPIITIAGGCFAALMGGSLILEQVFSIPGLGTYLFSGIASSDIPIVLGGVIVISIMTYIIILIVDLLYMAVDPRLRTAMLAPQKPKKVRKKEVSA